MHMHETRANKLHIYVHAAMLDTVHVFKKKMLDDNDNSYDS